MREKIFGWGYPPGAEHDPNAPYNKHDTPLTCPICGEDNSNWDNEFCSAKCERKYIELRNAWEISQLDCRERREGDE